MERDLSYLRTPDALKKSKLRCSNIFEVDGQYLVGTREVYDYLVEKGYTLTRQVVNLCFCSRKFSQENRDRYPELDPDNPTKIWRLVKRGAISRAKDREVDGDRVDGNCGVIYYVVDRYGNRYYGFTDSLDDEIQRVRRMIDSGALTSRNPQHYEIHAYDLVDSTLGDGKARRKIESLMEEFHLYNPDKRVVNLMDDFCRSPL